MFSIFQECQAGYKICVTDNDLVYFHDTMQALPPGSQYIQVFIEAYEVSLKL